MKDLTKLQELRAKVDAEIAKIESKAYAEPSEDPMAVVHCHIDHLTHVIREVYSYANYVEKAFYNYVHEHSTGHIPPIKGADKMKDALKALGIDGDYEVIKPVIFANTGRGGLEARITYKKAK